MVYKYDDTFHNYCFALVLGKPVLFSDMRIERKSLPIGVYCYSIRHDDEGLGEPCTVESNVMVNHYGDFISLEPFNLSNGYLELENEDFNLSNIRLSFNEYKKSNQLAGNLSD